MNVPLGGWITQFPLAPHPVQTPTYSMGTLSTSAQDKNGAGSPSRPTVIVPLSQRTQNPRNSPSLRMLGVGTSATSGLVLFLRIIYKQTFQRGSI